MSATKTKKTTTRKAKTTKKATKAALKSIEANLEAIDGAEGKKAKQDPEGAQGQEDERLDAAAQVLAEAGEPMNTRQMIEAMAAKKLWTSPGGKTPHATLYSAILREINEKGKDSRFTKTERGKFAANGKA